MDGIIRISPKIDELHPNRIITCTVPNCSSEFQNKANLQMHLDRHHHRRPISTNGMGIPENPNYTKWYFCPIENCSYYDNGEGLSKHFDCLKYLRQHYQKVHAAKVFQCDQCERTFGTEALRVRHEVNCGRVYQCDQCGWPYSSRESLLTHMRRKQHVSKVDKPKTGESKRVLSHETVIIGTPTTTPIQILVKLSTQTQDQAIQTEPVEIKSQQKRKRVPNPSKQPQAKSSKKLKNTFTEANNYQSLINPNQNLQHNLTSANEMGENNLNRMSYVAADQLEDSLTCLEQLVNSSNGLCDIETQTEHFTSTILDQMLYSHMHTQTCDEFLSELGLADIQTQTNLSSAKDESVDMGVPVVSSSYSMTSSGAHDEMLVSTETQTSFTQCLLEYNEAGTSSNGITQHTQTCETLLEGLFGGQESDLIGNFQSAYTQT